MYTIVHDLQALQRYVDWLPDTQPHEQYYISLLARAKYDPTGAVKNDKQQLKRVVATKDRIIEKIMQLQAPEGTYFTGKPGGPRREVPAHALALYMMPNPRDMWKAQKKAAKRFMDEFIEGAPAEPNPLATVRSCIQTTPSHNFVVTFDFDSHDMALIQPALDYMPEAISAIRTRGGYHIMVHPLKVPPEKRTGWYTTLMIMRQRSDPKAKVREKDGVIGDLMSPVPGCCQGGKVTQIVTLQPYDRNVICRP
jgi:hypothetical protein